ncbi:TIGR02281 family clan AA aspartic protease [Roseateles sp. BYS180W]|uniref:TIGR02281 family clan AA aspartic protease n=1 Tax=Roseateles rivi TaxID=3299028 RepID=A0ABW7FTI6_9BURK
MQKDLPHGLKLAAVWLGMVLVLFLGFKAWERQQQQSRIQLQDGNIVLQRAPDGHFHWRGQVNGVEVDFLVDTGATRTALPEALARQAGLQPEGEVQSNTAGGVVQGWVARADISLAGGVSAQRLPVTVLPQLSSPLLGMDVLGRMHFSQSPGQLTFSAP